MGLNIKGQLGHGNFDNTNKPKLVVSLLPSGTKNPKSLNPNIQKYSKPPIVNLLESICIDIQSLIYKLNWKSNPLKVYFYSNKINMWKSSSVEHSSPQLSPIWADYSDVGSKALHSQVQHLGVMISSTKPSSDKLTSNLEQLTSVQVLQEQLLSLRKVLSMFGESMERMSTMCPKKSILKPMIKPILGRMGRSTLRSKLEINLPSFSLLKVKFRVLAKISITSQEAILTQLPIDKSHKKSMEFHCSSQFSREETIVLH